MLRHISSVLLVTSATVSVTSPTPSGRMVPAGTGVGWTAFRSPTGGAWRWECRRRGSRDDRIVEPFEPPSAVFCYNDLWAVGAMRVARSRGLRIPADLSIVGFDDIYISEYLSPRLTTVRQPMRQMGRTAMEALLHLIAGEECEQNRKVAGELIVRESTAPPRTRL